MLGGYFVVEADLFVLSVDKLEKSAFYVNAALLQFFEDFLLLGCEGVSALLDLCLALCKLFVAFCKQEVKLCVSASQLVALAALKLALIAFAADAVVTFFEELDLSSFVYSANN